MNGEGMLRTHGEIANGRVQPGTHLRILCVDDRPEDAELERYGLAHAGYQVEATRVESEAELAAASRAASTTWPCSTTRCPAGTRGRR